MLTEKSLRMALGFVVTILLARYLGAENFGILSYCMALVALWSFLPVLGLETVVRRELALNPEAADTILSTVARLRFGAALLAGLLLAVLLWSQPVGENRENLLLALLGLTLLQPAITVPELYLQSRGLVRYSVTAMGLAALVAAALRVGLIMAEAPLAWFGVPAIGEMVCAWLGLARYAKKEGLRWWCGGFSKGRAVSLLSESWPLLISGAAVLLYLKVDQVMLRYFCGAAEVGIYAAAVRLSEAVFFIPGAVMVALLPSWAGASRQGGDDYARYLQRVYDGLAALAYGFALPVALLAGPLIRWLYGTAFAEAAAVLALHVWAGLFVFMGMARSQELNFAHANRITLWTTLAGALANVGLNLWLIPVYGAFGAALATVMSYALAIWVLAWLFSASRGSAKRQTVALLLPLLGWRYAKYATDQKRRR
ncbi:MAG: flippase [Opitutaceae bacterium]|nr:flippase [Opitutaceae bacterium]